MMLLHWINIILKTIIIKKKHHKLSFKKQKEIVPIAACTTDPPVSECLSADDGHKGTTCKKIKAQKTFVIFD